MKHSPIAVANTFVSRYGSVEEITHMKLQKLVFFAHGWFLALKGSPLVNEQPQVWRYGPVFRSLYSRLTGRRNNRIESPVSAGPFNEFEKIPDTETDSIKLIDWIWDKYGHLTAEMLSNLTHEDGTPWHTMASKYNFSVPPYLDMENELVQEYFSKLAEKEHIKVTS